MDKVTIIAQHKKEKEESTKFKERRFKQWNENYALYKDKVDTNRLTQRQPVNIPIIRETISSWISKIDEPPKLFYKTKGRTRKDSENNIALNELYKDYYKTLNLQIKDNVDKKVVGLQGRSFKKVGYADNDMFIDIIDPYDIDIDPMVDVTNINSARYIIHKHIYKPLSEILANNKYDSEARDELKTFMGTKEGIIKSKEDTVAAQAKSDRMKSLGSNEIDEYGGSEVLVEINESYKKIWDKKNNMFVRHLIITAADRVVLYNKPLMEAIGIDEVPITTWAYDPELSDFWSNGPADNTRTINKVVNLYFSQDLENRTYRNFGMYFYNTMNNSFQPKAYDAKPFGFYGMPGNPAEILMPVEIPQLGDTMGQIHWLKEMIQTSVAQTPLERGIKEPGEQTLGQTQLSMAQSKGINYVVAKNYRDAWEDTGRLFYLILSKNMRGAKKLSKRGADDLMYSKFVTSDDIVSSEGYEVIVEVEAEKSIADDFDLKKIQYIKNSFQDNPAAIKAAKKKELEIVDLFTDEEIEEILAAENPQPQNVEQVAPSKINNPQDSVLTSNEYI